MNRVTLCIILVVGLCSIGEAAVTNITIIDRETNFIEPCMVKSLYSYVIKGSSPPTNLDELRESCAQHKEGFKCFKERLPTLKSVLVKRGMASLMKARQGQQKKVCTDINSRASKQMIDAFHCIRKKRLEQTIRVDKIFAYNMQRLIDERKISNGKNAKELDQFCCAFLEYREGMVEAAGEECVQHKKLIAEIYQTVITSDLGLLCGDEDKLKDMCPRLYYKGPTPEPASSPSGIRNGLYLILTLGD